MRGAQLSERDVAGRYPAPAGANQRAQSGGREYWVSVINFFCRDCSSCYCSRMKRKSTHVVLNNPSDWKQAMLAALKSRQMTRYQFADAAAKKGICTQYTAASLLANDHTVRGKRRPAIDTAIDLANLIGCKIIFEVCETNAKQKGIGSDAELD